MSERKKPVKATSSPAREAAVSKTPAVKPPAEKAPVRRRRGGRGRKPSATAAPVIAGAPDAAVEDGRSWYRIDLHTHTPASHDYEQPEVSYLDLLRQAERRGLSILAFTDHNTANGYLHMTKEIAELELLERLERIRPDELGRLNEYRRLLKKITVLPGFEFTATFGFHILGIFPPTKPMRDIEHVLIQLKVPGPVIDAGLTEAGATSDVLSAYKAIADAGGLAIAAHANSTNGVSMRTMDFGGQTRIAYTQDANLAAVEWTDLERGRRSSSILLGGIRAEYPRRMHALQGSDAHRLAVASSNPKRLGIGERPTEVRLAEPTFAALKALLQSDDYAAVRPVFDVLDLEPETTLQARETGEGETQAFHPTLGKRVKERFDAVLRDVAAMANGLGGHVWVGCEAGRKKKPAGLKKAAEYAIELSAAIEARISPRAVTEVTVIAEQGVDLLRVTVTPDKDAPHTLDASEFLVREGAKSRPATRDEIVATARRAWEAEQQSASQARPHVQARTPHTDRQPVRQPDHSRSQSSQPGRGHPQQPARPQSVQGRPGQAPQPQSSQPGRATPGQPAQQPVQSAQPGGPQRGDQGRQGSGQRPPAQQRPLLPLVTRQPAAESDGSSAPMTAPALIEVDGTPAQAASVPQDTRATDSRMPSEATPGAHEPGLPRAGVEVVGMEDRAGTMYFSLSDTRNGSVTRNVTFKSARDLWHYAITMHNRNTYPVEKIVWQGNRAVLSASERAGKLRFDVAMRDSQGRIRIIYGATLESVDAEWKAMMHAAAQPAPQE